MITDDGTGLKTYLEFRITFNKDLPNILTKSMPWGMCTEMLSYLRVKGSYISLHQR